LKIAVVIPWFGRDLKGGAEQHAWQVAARLARRGHRVEVLTTCCRSHQEDWSTNHFPPGQFAEPEGFSVHRFPVDARNRPQFDRVCAHLLSLDQTTLRRGVSPVSAADSHIFATELIKSGQLLGFIAAKKDHFDLFIFLPYLYGLVLDGVRIVGRAAALQPCLHDEAYAYLPEVAEAFRAAGSLFFISEGEQALAFRLFGPGIWSKSTLTGAGIESPSGRNGHTPASAGSSTYPEKFLLYLGRKDAGKNVPLLLNAFSRFRTVRPNSSLRLLLAGHGKLDLNGCRDTAIDLGLVSEPEKQDLLRQCTALVQPSQNESFSRVMMEAWLHGKPVAAHARCLATAVAVKHSGGGWIAETESDWARLLTEIDRLPDTALSKLGAQGKRYAAEMADWESVMDRYERALARHNETGPLSPVLAHPIKGPSINQFLPNLAHGDAISNDAIFIRDQLRALGFRSEIYVRFIDPRVADKCSPFSPQAVMASEALIYHHSIGTEITPHILRYAGPKCLIYHNITPAKFFEPYRPEFAVILKQGRNDLLNLVPHFSLSLGDSTYNAEELTRCGFPHVDVLPICVDPAQWIFPPDPILMAKLQDGRTNVLFVGRIAPNKKQDDLLHAFWHYLAHDPSARLILVGSEESGDPYAAHLREIISSLNLGDSVWLAGALPEPQLQACYQTADLFWSMSEHEGFCVPLIEAMWFDIPILAFRSTAVPETLGDAAFMFHDKDSISELAAAAHVVLTDLALREKIIVAQRKAREKFLPKRIIPRIANLARQLIDRIPSQTPLSVQR
jgi:glycosyltransferase involved in cell wall biosynthesis